MAAGLAVAVAAGRSSASSAATAARPASSIAVDSKGNIYTTEVDTGKRAQKFVFRGTFPVEE